MSKAARAAECDRRRGAGLVLEGRRGLLIRADLDRLGAIWDGRSRLWLLPDCEAVAQAEVAARAATRDLVARTASAIVAHLEAAGSVERAGEVRFRCPAPEHEDTTPSATFNPSRGAWHCFGCGARGNVMQLARMLGVEPGSGPVRIQAPGVARDRLEDQEWVPSTEPARLRFPELGEPTRAWQVRDAGGRLFGVHARFESTAGGKEYRWWRGGRWGLGGLRVASAPLWGSELLAAVPAAQVVYVTEGEKAAEALLQRGYAAVATVTGAHETPGPRALAVLRGRRVVLWPDADDVGRAHMERVAERLRAVAAEVAVVETFGQDGSDAADVETTEP